MKTQTFDTEIAGRTLTATFSDLADQTNGSVLVKYGDTVVMATAVMSKNQREGIDYFPLVVDYEEKFYAVGKILGGRFIKREGRPSDEAILAGRIVDRTIRPLFEDYIRNEVQVVITVLSFDEKNDPDTISVIAASLALGTSDIPWNGPVGAIRIGKNDNGLVINPGNQEQLGLDLLVCGKEGKINMIEAESKEILENELSDIFDLAINELNKIEDFQKKVIKEIGKQKKEIVKPQISDQLQNLFNQNILEKIKNDLDKEALTNLKTLWLEQVKNDLPEENISLALSLFEQTVNNIIHRLAIDNKKRVDNRGIDEIRPIYTQAGGLSDIVHGSGIFYRGGTHILSVLTLSGPKDSQIIEGMEIQEKKYFMHHYNFPPFSTGETGRIGGMNRRAIGHGALAEKSLKAVLPTRETFPYTIRLVSEAMASNGSTSMGSVCGSTLALMDGGVPITRPVAGIAMGLMMDNEEKYQILTDIQGPEDHYGDMDFKVAGTTEGITGIQLDIKVEAIPVKILKEALIKAREARLVIINKITETINQPRPNVKPSAPSIISIKIPVDKIGMVIGSGGKTIQKIILDTGAEVEIEDDGTVYITGKQEAANKAREIVLDITREYKKGDKLDGVITRIVDFGAFAKIGHDKEGLIHISEIASFRVEKVNEVLTIDQKVPLIIKEIDEKGRINLSIKEADPNFITKKN